MKAPYVLKRSRPGGEIGESDKIFFSRFLEDPELEFDEYDDFDDADCDSEDDIDECLDDMFDDLGTVFIEE